MKTDYPVKQLEDIPVMYTSYFGNPAENDAFTRLEEPLTSLQGRRFFGVSWWGSNEYRACMRIEAEDDPAALGFETFTLPGGRYAYTKLKGKYEDLIKQIPGEFKKLSDRCPVDKTRPAIEFYRRHEEFILYVPVE